MIFEKLKSAIFMIETLILVVEIGSSYLSSTHNGKFIGINGLLICFSAHTGEKMSKNTYFDMKKVDFGTFGFEKL